MSRLLSSASPIIGFPALREISLEAGPQQAMRSVAEILGDPELDSAEIARWIRGLAGQDVSIVGERSVERTSHLKWFLGQEPNGLTVWLHQYKGEKLPDSVGFFAASIHNHRYSFASRVLSGGLLVSHFRECADKPLVRMFQREEVGEGSVYTMTANEIHRIDQTSASTCTLVVQGLAERKFSRVFASDGGSYEDKYDMPAMLPDLVDLLARA
jgi:hypothetical protein